VVDFFFPDGVKDGAKLEVTIRDLSGKSNKSSGTVRWILFKNTRTGERQKKPWIFNPKGAVLTHWTPFGEWKFAN
jgi:hypothetical protein